MPSDAILRSPAFVSPKTLHSASQAELEETIDRLKNILMARLEKRKKRRRHLSNAEVCESERKVYSRKRASLHMTPIVHRQEDVVMNVDTLRRLCLETFIVGKSPPRVSTADRMNVQQMSSSRNVLKRLSLKLEKKQRTQPLENSEAPRDVPEKLVELRNRVHEVREKEKEVMLKSGFTPKQLLNEFSTYGLKMKAKRKVVLQRTPSPESPAKGIVSLIDTVDRRLSTTDALAVLKQLGIEYQPRSAMGKKNLMATGLSSLLASNGLKLMGENPAPVTDTNQG